MIVLKEVTKTYPGMTRPVIENLTLEVPEGKTVVLLGSSGCGKTTILKMIDRMIEPTAGAIEIDGRDIRAENPIRLRRSIGHVFQQPCLFPHMTIEENVGILLKLENQPKQEIAEKVDELLMLTGLNPKRYKRRYPSELSGGQQQRVGVARALSLKPKCLLLDEPFGALDNITRRALQDEIKRIREKFSVTIVFVTHDIMEAVYLGDTIAVMNAGKIEQLGTGEEIVQHPETDFVRDLIAKPFAEMKRISDQMLESL